MLTRLVPQQEHTTHQADEATEVEQITHDEGAAAVAGAVAAASAAAAAAAAAVAAAADITAAVAAVVPAAVARTPRLGSPSTDWVEDMSVPNPECQLAAPNPQRSLPPQLCPHAKTRVLLLSFFTRKSHGTQWTETSRTKGVKNRMCFAAARGYRYVVEVVDDAALSVPVPYYKVYVVQQYVGCWGGGGGPPPNTADGCPPP